MTHDTYMARTLFKPLASQLSEKKRDGGRYRQTCPTLIPQSSSEGDISFVLMEAAQESRKENGSLDGCWLLALYPI